MRHYLREFGEGFILLYHDRKHLKSRYYAVARGGVVEKDYVARLLASEVVSVFREFLDHVPVADVRPHHAASHLLDRHVKGGIAHYGRDDRFFLEPSFFDEGLGAYGHYAVSVNDIAFFVKEHATVSVY